MLIAKFKKQLHSFQLDVDFQADMGVLGILGPSGCGKSMTLKCIAGIETPDSGYIELDGVVMYDSASNINLTPQNRRVGYLFQHYALFPTMTVEQNLLAGVRPEDFDDPHAEVLKVIQTLNLEGIEKKKPHLISGGQRQRVALGRILLNQPKILMLDEPLSALDQFLKWQVQLELVELFERLQKTVLLVTHNREEIFQLCDTVTVLTDGKNEVKQSVSELFTAPQSLSAGVLAGCRNFSRVEILNLEQGLFNALDWGVNLRSSKLTASSKHCGAYSQSFKVVADLNAETQNILPVTCLHRFGKGVTESLVCSTPGGSSGASILYTELDARDTALPNVNDQFHLAIAPPDLVFFDN
ncbi:MAG: ATP-binding cassette domain-containing protein [Chloroflexi bacterium]|nr:ATP-binding cassette domain-containing protein [Chloroflexota bacterium]